MKYLLINGKCKHKILLDVVLFEYLLFIFNLVPYGFLELRSNVGLSVKIRKELSPAIDII
jgi:hypothetical protein